MFTQNLQHHGKKPVIYAVTILSGTKIVRILTIIPQSIYVSFHFYFAVNIVNNH